MGKRKLKGSGLFDKLGNNRPSLARGHRFENEILVLAEDNNIPKNLISFSYDGPSINILINVEKVPSEFVDKVEALVQGFEDGDILPPSKEELKDMEELVEELKED